MNILTVSPSPHTYSEDNVPKLMYGVILALLPAFLVEPFSHLLVVNDAVYKALKDFFQAFINGDESVLELKKLVEQHEKEIDGIQFKATRVIFKSELPKIEKFHLKWVLDKFCKMLP